MNASKEAQSLIDLACGQFEVLEQSESIHQMEIHACERVRMKLEEPIFLARSLNTTVETGKFLKTNNML